MLESNNKSVVYRAKFPQVVNLAQASVVGGKRGGIIETLLQLAEGLGEDRTLHKVKKLLVLRFFFFPRIAHSDMGFNFKGEKCWSLYLSNKGRILSFCNCVISFSTMSFRLYKVLVVHDESVLEICQMYHTVLMVNTSLYTENFVKKIILSVLITRKR